MTRDDLKVKIKDLASQGHLLRGRIQRTAGLERHALWNEKRSIGQQARAALLAYGFLRGVSYHRIEGHCRADGRLRPSQLLAMWACHLGIQPVWSTQPFVTGDAPRAVHPGVLGFFKRLVAEPASAAAAESIWSEARVTAWLEAPAATQSPEAAVR
jgi:hypothetical protein